MRRCPGESTHLGATSAIGHGASAMACRETAPGGTDHSRSETPARKRPELQMVIDVGTLVSFPRGQLAAGTMLPLR